MTSLNPQLSHLINSPHPTDAININPTILPLGFSSVHPLIPILIATTVTASVIIDNYIKHFPSYHSTEEEKWVRKGVTT